MYYIPGAGVALGGLSKLYLNTVDSVDTVNEQYQNEDKGYLRKVSGCQCIR